MCESFKCVHMWVKERAEEDVEKANICSLARSLALRGARIHMRAPPPPVYVLVCTRRYALPPARQIPELTLLLHVVASSSPLRRAQKTVSCAIDGALKSNILICVRWYCPINILSRVHGIPCSLLLRPPPPDFHFPSSLAVPLLCFWLISVPVQSTFRCHCVQRVCASSSLCLTKKKQQQRSVKQRSRGQRVK